MFSGVRKTLGQRRAAEDFKSDLEEYLGVGHCFLISSGQAALAATLLALKELNPNRDEVVIPAFTCYSVPAAILRAGLKIRICDLDAERLDFDFGKLSLLLRDSATAETSVDHSAAQILGSTRSRNTPMELNGKILAVITTHYFGLPADPIGLRSMIKDPAIYVIEDAAQALGESLGKNKLGTLGDVGFYSLARGKAFSTVEGGIIVTNRGDIAAAIRRIVDSLATYSALQQFVLVAKSLAISLLIHPRLFWIPKAVPFLRLGETLFDPDFKMLRMSEFQAALAANWQHRLENVRLTRIANSKRWEHALEVLALSRWRSWKVSSHALIRYPIRILDEAARDEVLRMSEECGMGMMRGYLRSINRIPELANADLGGPFKNAEQLASQLVTLPTHAFLRSDDVERIITILSRALGPLKVN